MPNPPVLRGYRRELTKEIFEDLAALQCEPSEILGYIGTTRQKLEACADIPASLLHRYI